ncbi:MAG: primosomal protein N' [Sphaerochaetaceae bacterium]
MYIDVVINRPLNMRFTYKEGESLKAEVGLRVVVPFGKQDVTAYVVDTFFELADVSYEIKEIKRVVDDQPLFGKKEIELAQWMANFYLCSEGEALSLMIPGGKREVDLPHLPVSDEINQQDSFELSDEQSVAIKNITAAKEGLFYLWGVTGSGKSEVFLSVAESVIAEGKQVIYLVPEITLTHQLAKLVTNRFKNKVAILHSQMKASQRISAWRKIHRGEVKVVIGARSAVFAPFKNLGLIILDEEHENSYKSGSTPRYHARQVAQRRASVEKALLVMGSATPSTEAFLMMQENRIVKQTLSSKVAGGKVPQMVIVNMLNEKRILSKTLQQEIHKTLANKKQVILFLNRRGFSYYFHCNSCGYSLSCPHCSVALTFHKHKNQLVCHYCGYKKSPVSVCPNCNSVDIGYGGFGTEMVEQEVKLFFPTAKTERLDTDSATDKEKVGEILDNFRDGKTDILLGTQMVAKGLNFPLVDLVGIVLADSSLNLPDFRSQERTFSLITQVSGRTGRFNDAGKVIIQTFNSDNSAIRLAKENLVEQFYLEELQQRKETNFPPYSRLINFVIRGKDNKKCASAIEQLKTEIDKAIFLTKKKGSFLDVLGPTSCPIEKIAGSWRYHLVLRGNNVAEIIRVASIAKESFKVPSALYLEIDVDPLQIL